MKGLADLNYQDLHGNDDCLFMLAEWEGRKSLAERPADPPLDGRSLSWIKLWQIPSLVAQVSLKRSIGMQEGFFCEARKG